jgi:hypothetical protein
MRSIKKQLKKTPSLKKQRSFASLLNSGKKEKLVKRYKSRALPTAPHPDRSIIPQSLFFRNISGKKMIAEPKIKLFFQLVTELFFDNRSSLYLAI